MYSDVSSLGLASLTVSCRVLLALNVAQILTAETPITVVSKQDCLVDISVHKPLSKLTGPAVQFLVSMVCLTGF